MSRHDLFEDGASEGEPQGGALIGLFVLSQDKDYAVSATLVGSSSGADDSTLVIVRSGTRLQKPSHAYITVGTLDVWCLS